jgi:hypothetical protein
MSAGRRCLTVLFVGFSVALAVTKEPAPGQPQKPEDKPPTVVFMPESTRHPDPNDFDGGEEAKQAHDWGDRMPLTVDGRIMVIYHAKSDNGIRAANLRYRVVAKGVAVGDYPEEYRKIAHPRDDPKAIVFPRLPLKPFEGDPEKLKLGKFDPDLGLFEKSWQGLDGPKRGERFGVNVEFYLFPGGKEAGGRINLLAAGVLKTVPDGKGGVKTAKVEVGDAIELYVEVFDNATNPDGKPDRTRPAGYTAKPRQKTVVTPEEAFRVIRERNQKKP